jgi:hypothetical protein
VLQGTSVNTRASDVASSEARDRSGNRAAADDEHQQPVEAESPLPAERVIYK